MVIGDASGKSVPAALMIAQLQAVLKNEVRDAESVVQVMESLNRCAAAGSQSERFVTMVYGQLDPRTGLFRYCNAGHNYPIHIKGDGTWQNLDTGGLLLGVFEEASYEEGEIQLEPDDVRWQGPFESAYGQHLVMLTKRTEGIYPPLEEIADTVREDALRIKLDEQNERAVQAIVDTYDIRVDEVRGAGGAGVSEGRDRARYARIAMAMALMAMTVFVVGRGIRRANEPAVLPLAGNGEAPSIPSEAGVFRLERRALAYRDAPEPPVGGRTLVEFYDGRAYPGAPPPIPSATCAATRSMRGNTAAR